MTHLLPHSMTLTARKPTRGFTLIELMVVIGIAMLLAGFALPTVSRSVRSGALNQSADRLQGLIVHAQNLARSQVATSLAAGEPYFGVTLVGTPEGQQYATLVFGDALDDELIIDGRAAMRVDLPPHIRLYVGDAGATPAELTTGRSGFFFRPGDGRPVAEAAINSPPRDMGIFAASARPAYNWSGVTLPPVLPAPRCSAIELRPLGSTRGIRFGVLAIGTPFHGAIE